MLRKPGTNNGAASPAQKRRSHRELFSGYDEAPLGFSYEDLRALNPKLIYCSLSGYGQTGPDSQLPGFDVVVQARGGMMSVTGPAETPSIVGISIIDLFAGLATSGILAA